MSPTNMQYYDDYYKYCQAAVHNTGIQHPMHMYQAYITQPIQYAPFCVPQRTFVHHYIPPTNVEYQTPQGPQRTPQECATPPKKLKFSIDSILGLNEDKNVSSEPVSPTYEKFAEENLDSLHPHQHYAVSTTQSPHSQHSGSVSPQPGCYTSESNCSSPERGGKQKRMRTIFTPEQLQKLEEEFSRQQYMVGEERLFLAHSLGLTEAQVKVWFQNRRIKYRKQTLEMQQNKLMELQSESSESKNEESELCQQRSPSSEQTSSRDCPEDSTNTDQSSWL